MHSGRNILNYMGTVIKDCVSCTLRTDESFSSRVDEKHHKSLTKSTLENFPIKMVSQFVIDSMHCCFIGVTKKLLTRLLVSKRNEKKTHIDANSRRTFGKKLFVQRIHPC